AWFSVGVLSLLPPSPNPPIRRGARVMLTGVVRGVRGVAVQQSTAGGAWQRLRNVRPTGAFHLSVEPRVTTDYRLVTANDAAAPVRIRVKTATVR
ncbi:MAG TPA: hypothetical protein VJV76_06995, partial [Gaiellaceae bacterium]|nr:hypothetical protein [Gaiellaceae bacterium]